MKQILIVDDEPEILDILESRFDAKGYRVIRAVDGNSALRQMQAEKPSIVLMDVTMPEPNGYMVCRTIKDNEALKHTPVILLTGRDSDSDRFWGEESGADAYITKPYELTELLKAVERLIGTANGDLLDGETA